MLLACSEPDPCGEMCSTATQHYGGCLANWDLSWPDAGYDDENAFFHSCETRAWTSRQLEKDAGREGSTEQECVELTAFIDEPTFTCDDWLSIDWNSLPW